MGESFPMVGGDGAQSYTKNSQVQKLGFDSVKKIIRDQVMKNLDAEKLLSISTTVAIADFGCSVGPNTFFAVQNLIEAVESKCSSSSSLSSSKTLEFLVFFSDHTSNDFNTLFASLPPERPYRAAGVPGSFHGRLLPSDSIAVAHSAYSLHWLSKAPELGLSNEGRIHYMGAAEHVRRAYSDQFEKDLEGFLSARAEEIVSGGLMFLTIPGNIEEYSSDLDLGSALLLNVIGDSLTDIALEGTVEKSAVDGFNMPMYFATEEEMRRVVEKNGCFSIERMELTHPTMAKEKEKAKIDGDRGDRIMELRAGTEATLSAHFGKPAVDKLFSNMLARTHEILPLMEAAWLRTTQLLLVLKRN